MRSKRFVLDANIWVSYFITNNLSVLIETVAINKIRLIYCEELLTEIERVLKYPHLQKYNIEIRKAIQFVKQVGIFAFLVYPIKQYIPDDENDSYIIALALQQNAGFVTSGDKHILSQKTILETKYKKLTILTKAQFEGMFYN
jgi:uncharacterized protein